MSFTDVTTAVSHWAFLPTLVRLALALGYRRLRRVGTRTSWQRWRQNIYLRKLDRLLGRTSWKFFRSFGNYSYWALRFLPELPRMATPSEPAINNVRSADHCWIRRSSLWQRPCLYSCRHRSDNGCLTGLEATNYWICDRS